MTDFSEDSHSRPRRVGRRLLIKSPRVMKYFELLNYSAVPSQSEEMPIFKSDLIDGLLVQFGSVQSACCSWHYPEELFYASDNL